MHTVDPHKFSSLRRFKRDSVLLEYSADSRQLWSNSIEIAQLSQRVHSMHTESVYTVVR